MKTGRWKHRTPRGERSSAFGSGDVRGLPVLIFLLLIFSARAAEDFGDVSVSAAAMFTGSTFHGYGEIRVTLENHSHTKAHVVTLRFPNRAWNNGNSLGRVARSVKLEPDAREVVSLLQPPLPANGDGQIRVEVDGRQGGSIVRPNANNHCNSNSRGEQATMLISRSLDFDAVSRVFLANRGAFTAAMAVGPPDAVGGGWQPNTWMPDTRSLGRTNWLELDCATSQIVNRITIYSTSPTALSGTVTLIGISGTNLAKWSMMSAASAPASHKPARRSSGWTSEFSFPPTSEPVKTLRLNYGKEPPSNISVDAVQIFGPSGSQWASAARASSDNSASAGAYLPGRLGADSVDSLRAESPVSEWSENWLAFTPFDAVVLNGTEMTSMSPAVLAAIGDYLSAGGNVVLAGKTELPALWLPAQKKSLRDGFEYDVGFGRCFAFGSENSAALNAQTVQTLRVAVRETARYWQLLPADSAAANAAMPVVENLQIPTRGLVIIMLAFIIVIGPVNLVLLNRRRRRTWMLWTIPAISGATTLLVFAYSLLREGITPDTRIAGLTVIDQASHHATTLGATAFYCPLTPSGGLHFDYETEVTPLVSRGYGSGASREVDWTQAQQFTRGWISARVPAHFHLRKSETRRERIQIVNENGKLQIVNGLSAPIKSLWVADADMNIYQTTSVPAGQKAGLIPAPPTRRAEKSGANGLLREIAYIARPGPLDGGGAGRFLTPNSYIAVLEGNPFIENALGSAARPKRTKSSAVVFGLLEPQVPQ